MPNSIRYSTTGSTLSLKKGNFYFGTGDVEKGPTVNTGYLNGVTPSAGGYTIYLYNASQPQNIAYHSANNDAQLISFTNNLAGQSFTSSTQCLNWYSTQNNYVCVNRDYESIVTNGLVLNLDAGFTPSYPKSGTTWYDTSLQTNNGTLISQSQFVDGSTPYFQYSGNNQNVEVTVATVELNTNSSEGNTVEQFIWSDGSQGNGNMPFSFYNVAWDTWFLGNTFAINNGSSLLYGFNGATELLLNKWCHVVAYFPNNWPSSSGSTKIYINGVSKSLSLINGTLESRTISSSQTVGIGGGYTGGADTFNWNGRIALTRIYNRELSSSEVLQNYQAQFPRFLGENIVTNGLVNYLDAGYRTSYPTTGTTWYDVSGYGRNGTLTNGPTYGNISGGTIVFDGTDDYVTLGSQNLVTNNFTINLWYNLNTNTTKEHFLFSIGYASANSFLIVANSTLGGSQSISSYYVNTGGSTTGRTINSTTLTNTQIVNLTYTRNNGLNVIYINGVEQTSRTFTESLSLGSSLQYILGYAIPRNKTSAYLQGNIYISQIYNRGLSSSEILQNFNAQKSRFGL
jgi:hypothetical protein